MVTGDLRVMLTFPAGITTAVSGELVRALGQDHPQAKIVRGNLAAACQQPQ